MERWPTRERERDTERQTERKIERVRERERQRQREPESKETQKGCLLKFLAMKVKVRPVIMTVDLSPWTDCKLC